jgi:hypothetical protein
MGHRSLETTVRYLAPQKDVHDLLDNRVWVAQQVRSTFSENGTEDSSEIHHRSTSVLNVRAIWSTEKKLCPITSRARSAVSILDLQGSMCRITLPPETRLEVRRVFKES